MSRAARGGRGRLGKMITSWEEQRRGKVMRDKREEEEVSGRVMAARQEE